MGVGLVAQVQAFYRDCVAGDAGVLGVASVLFVFIVLQRQADLLVIIKLIAEATLQVVGIGVHVAALGRVLGNALAITVELIVALHGVAREVPVHRALAPGGALERLVSEPLVAEVVAGGHADLAAERQVFTLVAFGDDVDDAARCACAVDTAGAGDHFDTLDAFRCHAVELAEVIARGVLRNPVDQDQGITPAKRLAEVAHAAAGRGNARHQLAEDICNPTSCPGLLADLRFIDHLH